MRSKYLVTISGCDCYQLVDAFFFEPHAFLTERGGVCLILADLVLQRLTVLTCCLLASILHCAVL